MKSTANHYTAFYALQKLDDALRPHGRLFDEMRTARHSSIYEPVHDEGELAQHLSEARTLVPGALAALHAAIIARRPSIAYGLPLIR